MPTTYVSIPRREDPVYLDSLPSDSSYIAVISGDEIADQAGIVEPIWHWLPELIALYNDLNTLVTLAGDVELFYKSYIGGAATGPTVDPKGNALVEGTSYTNTGDDTVYIWNGTSWFAWPAAGSLDDLLDVDAPTPALNDVLAWDGNQWVNAPVGSGGGPIELEDLTDVDLTSPSQDDVLTYDSGIWKNLPATGGAAVVVGATPPASPQEGDIWSYWPNTMVWDSSAAGGSGAWVEVGRGGNW